MHEILPARGWVPLQIVLQGSWCLMAPEARHLPDFAALQAWLRTNETRVPDALDLFAAIDEVRGDRACAPCRARLRALLWSASPQPPAQVPRRAPADDAGRRYLDALQQEPAR